MNDKAIKKRAKLPMSKSTQDRKSKIEQWNQIPWKRASKVLFSLQRRIYQASLRGDVKAIRRLQKLLLSSFFAKAIAVRRVTTDNQGKKTAGVENIIFNREVLSSSKVIFEADKLSKKGLPY